MVFFESTLSSFCNCFISSFSINLSSALVRFKLAKYAHFSPVSKQGQTQVCCVGCVFSVVEISAVVTSFVDVDIITSVVVASSVLTSTIVKQIVVFNIS